MRGTIHWGPSSIWHHRVLGTLWALCGCVVVRNVVRVDSWAKSGLWIVLLIAASYVATGAGFICGRTWARRTMVVLMVVASLWFLDMLLMSGVDGNRAGVRQMLVALGVAGYTLVFLAISAAWHSQELP
jgi:hypothetical protein